MTQLHPGYRVYWLNPETQQEIKASVKTVYKNKVKLLFADQTTQTVPIEDVTLATLKPKNHPFYETYLKVQKQYPDCLILYQNGEILETYGDQAEQLASELDLIKSSKAVSDGGAKVTVTGFPTTSKKYLLELWAKQIKVKVCNSDGEIVSIFEIEPFPIGTKINYKSKIGTVLDYNNISCHIEWDDASFRSWQMKSDLEAVQKEPIAESSEPDNEPKIEYLDISEIRIDGGTQQRVKLDLPHVANLVAQLEDGHELEPVTVFFDGENYWLADGFHRVKAVQDYGNGYTDAIGCQVIDGDRRSAVLYSVGANSDHKPCLPRSRADKRRAVECLLNDPEWSQWSDREIARQCKVSDFLVRSIREKSQIPKNDTIKVNRNGTEFEMTKPKHDKTTSPIPLDKLTQTEQVNTTSEPNSPDLNSNVIPINQSEIYLAFVSNVDQMSEEMVLKALRAIFGSILVRKNLTGDKAKYLAAFKQLFDSIGEIENVGTTDTRKSA